VGLLVKDFEANLASASAFPRISRSLAAGDFVGWLPDPYRLPFRGCKLTQARDLEQF